jgi:molecular chaperone DnaK
LSTASQKAGTALYQQAQAAQAAAGGGTGETPFGDAGPFAGGTGEPGAGPSFTKESPADDVVDAEIIDEDDKK